MVGRLAWTVAVTVLSLASLKPAEASANSHAKEIRDLVREKLGEDGPGAAVFVARHGKLLYLAGYGLANIETGAAITPDSLFDLASVSKQFTGSAILTLAQNGELELTDPVVDYVEDFRVPVIGRAITIQDLLYHVSGLADYTGEEWDGSDAEFAELTPETHLQWLNGTESRRAPGVKYVYNNSEYALLALIVERVSGMSYARYLREAVLKPAGLKATMVLDGETPLPKHAVTGYSQKEGEEVEVSSAPTVITGDGNVYTSIRDLARWEVAMREHAVIAEKWQRRAWQNGRLDNGQPIRDAEGSGYGFGWVIEADGSQVSHSGSWDGTSTALSLNLETGLSVGVLSNNENADASALGEEIAALFDDE